MVKKTIISLVSYFFCSFTLLVCGEENILPRSRSRSEPGVFWPLGAGAGAAQKKYQEPEPLGKKSEAGAGAGAAWKNSQKPEPEPLEKKSGAGAAKEFAGSPALVQRFNISYSFFSFLHLWRMKFILTFFLISLCCSWRVGRVRRRVVTEVLFGSWNRQINQR